MKEVRKDSLKTASWRATDMCKFIHRKTRHEFDLSYVRRLMKKWGFTQKVPVLEHVNRASRRRIRRFQKNICKAIRTAKAQGYTICTQDESIAVAEARPRRGVYTPSPTRGPSIRIRGATQRP